MENQTIYPAKELVSDAAVPSWILWNYVAVYQSEGIEFKGAH
jgi:hypothetical protein